VTYRSIFLTLIPVLALGACEPQRIGTAVLFPCSHPKPDTTGWRRIAGPFPGYTILAPPALRRTRGGPDDAMWQDSTRSVRVFRRAWGEAQFQDRDASHANYSSCWTNVAGMRTYLVVKKLDAGYQVTGWYRRGGAVPASAGPLDGVVSGASRVAADQATFLRVVESLQAR
jgi:hypothetical protein